MRSLTRPILSRRQLLHLAGALGVAGSALGLATACGGTPPTATSRPKPPEKPSPQAAAPSAPVAAATKSAAGQPTAAPAKPAATPGGVGTDRPIAGQTVKALLINHVYWQAVKQFLPEFTDMTGAKVELDLQGFDVANQRIELELSGGTGALDVTNNTFILSGKWIGANWCTDVTPLINDPQMTDKTKLDLADFSDGAIKPFQRGDKLYGLPWVGETTMLLYRKDVFDKNGIAGPPKTFDEMVEIAKKVHTKEVAGNLTRGTNGLHWVWPTYLFSYGGSFFAKPPDDMTPVLNSPESIKSADVFGVLSRDYGVPGSVSFSDADAQTSFNQGKAAMFLDALGVLAAALDPQKSTVHDKVSFALPPAGSAGQKPQIAAHAVMIPAATKDKRKGWEFMKWATSKELQSRIALDKNDPAIPRKSVLSNPKYTEKFRWGGADMGALQDQVFKLAGAGYMFYRTIPEFGPIGDRVTIALSDIISKQRDTKGSMDSLNKDVAAILEKAGYKLRKS